MTDEELKPCPFCGEPAEVDMSRGFRALKGGKLCSGVAIYCSAYCHVELMLSREDSPEYDNDQLLAILTENWNKRALEAALSSGGVRVKPLEWKPIGPADSDIEAETELGAYVISVDSVVAGRTHYLWVAGQGESEEHHSDYTSMAEAKAAAQADYERRILAALDVRS